MTTQQASIRTVYYARSRSNPNQFHEVTNCRGRWICQCPHNTKGRKECDHIKNGKAGKLRAATLKVEDAPLPAARRARTSEAGRDMADMLDV